MGEILHLLHELFRMRLIDKIARPIDNKKREEIVKEYKKKFD